MLRPRLCQPSRPPLLPHPQQLLVDLVLMTIDGDGFLIFRFNAKSNVDSMKDDVISLDAAQAADMRMARCNRDMIKAEPPLIVSLVKVFWNKMSEVATTHYKKNTTMIMKALYSHTETVCHLSFLRPNFQVHCSLFFVLSNPIQSNTIQREYRLFRFTSTPVSFIRHLNIFCH